MVKFIFRIMMCISLLAMTTACSKDEEAPVVYQEVNYATMSSMGHLYKKVSMYTSLLIERNILLKCMKIWEVCIRINLQVLLKLKKMKI